VSRHLLCAGEKHIGAARCAPAPRGKLDGRHRLGCARPVARPREIGDHLVISHKTADRHIQNIYNKISVSTRAAAALWAMQHELVG
jgi:hypothetical protein